MTPITPLDSWIHRFLKGSCASGRLVRSDLESWQFARIRQTLGHAMKNSMFYRVRLAGWKENAIRRPRDMADLPFTTEADLKNGPLHFLCVSHTEIDRCVTLQTSGTSGPPKRVFFTGEDLERTMDFFHHGMSTCCGPGDRVMILFPGDRPNTAGDLLSRTLPRLKASAILIPPFTDPMSALDIIRKEKITCLVGLPVPVLALTRFGGKKNNLRGQIHSVLLTADHIAEALARAVEKGLGCQVFGHYGMTEMGWGGGVECTARNGYHMREADLYIEIVDPDTGMILPDGETGEIVVTTLTRTGMPLIRYRTGDISRFHRSPCPCGTVLKRLDQISCRKNGLVRLKSGVTMTISMLDEALFDLENILDFQAELTQTNQEENLTIALLVAPGSDPHQVGRQATKKLAQLPFFADSRLSLIIQPGRYSAGSISSPGTSKRTLRDHRHV